MGITAIRASLKNYIDKLQSQLPLDGVYLYGSWAENKATQESDVDLLILSSYFKQLSEEDRDRLLYRLSVGIPLELHIYGLTPDEYKNASRLTTIGAVRDSGRIINLLSQRMTTV
jgi:predicted nucleotidyltransferase